MGKVILVDSNDIIEGEMQKMDAHIKAKLHRAVSVFIINKQSLLQKRALSKYHSPGLWTNTASTHPRPNEINKNAAIRRLKEEMGIDERKLTKAFNFIYKEKLDNELTEYEFDHVFIGFFDASFIPEPNEVCDFKYLEAETLMEDIKKIIPELYSLVQKNYWRSITFYWTELTQIDLMKNIVLKSILIFVTMAGLFSSCTSIPKAMRVVSPFSKDQYLGKWYEIARFNFRFERGLNNSTAEYSIRDDGKIKVLNRGFNYETKECKQAIGKTKFAGTDTAAMLKVSFFVLFIRDTM